ncbi:MAG: LytR C-terminal domain-containing protein [Actinomycetota bacterium]|nr:LytR C-terminal domain-containing protein [Actinomycetota bacterium]
MTDNETKPSKGRHATGGAGAFYRDLAMMILGIILVGAAVFFLLVLLADNPESESAATSTTGEVTSTSPETTTPTSVASTTSTSSTSTTSTSTPVPVRPPEEVRVVVLNSIGLAGAAGRLTNDLSEAGYQTLQADDYEPEQTPSKIWFRDGFSAEASELLEFISDARIEVLPDDSLQEGADVILVLGTGYEE